ALLGRFLPRLGPLAHRERPFFFGHFFFLFLEYDWICPLHRSKKRPCFLCAAVASYCGAVAPRVTAALLGRFLPRLGPLAHRERPFFFFISRDDARHARSRDALLGGGAIGSKLLDRNLGQSLGQRFEIGCHGGEGGRPLVAALVHVQ